MPAAKPRAQAVPFQSTAGNLATLRALGMQPALRVGAPSDPEEREADLAADAFVARAPLPVGFGARGVFADLRRKCSACEEEPALRRKAESGGAPAAGAAGHALPASGGEPLAPRVRRDYEGFFGADLSAVRVHTGESADAAARALSATAFAHRDDLYFSRGRFDPATHEGQRLLAHELAHTQQREPVVRREAAAAPQEGSQGGWLDDLRAAAAGASHGVASAIGAGAEAVAAGVRSAVSGATAAASAIAAAAKNALSGDAEKTRANLLAQVSGARREAQAADRDAVQADATQIAALNANISAVNGLMEATPLPYIPALPSIIEAILGFLEALAALLAAILDILLIAAIVVIIIIIVVLLLRNATGKYAPKPTTSDDSQPKTGPKTGPEPGPKPWTGPGPSPMPWVCPAPTGLTELDPIPITWFKPRHFYPAAIVLSGEVFHRDDPPSRLPTGEPIGVVPEFWPAVGKPMQLVPEGRGPGADRFRAVLARNGFDWRGLQADHVQDIEFGGPDDSGFVNLWPMDASANMSAGARTQGQIITVCLFPMDNAPVTGMFGQLKVTHNLYGRFFAIRDISL